MANSYTEFSNPNSNNFTINFPYLATSDIYAMLDGVDITNKIVSVVGSLVTFNETITGDLLKIYRSTPKSTLTFQNKTIIRSSDLNDLNLRNQYISEEIGDTVLYDVLKKDATDTNFTAEGKRIKNVDDAIEDTDAVNLGYITDLYGTTESAAASASIASQRASEAANYANESLNYANTSLSHANDSLTHATESLNHANASANSAAEADEQADRAGGFSAALSQVIEVVSGLDGGDARGITLALEGGTSNMTHEDSYEGGGANRVDPATTFDGGGAI